jgi:hypothetical protein
MEEFKRTWKLFREGTKELNKQILRNGKTPFFVNARVKFCQEVMDPMDSAWRALSEEERYSFNEEPFNGPKPGSDRSSR